MGLRYCVVPTVIEDVWVCFVIRGYFTPRLSLTVLMLYAMIYINDRMFSATLSLNNPFSLQQMWHNRVWNHHCLCI